MKIDFKAVQNEYLYDVEFDEDIIAQSIAKQYHILPSEQPELSYRDWGLMVSGLMPDTPLGAIVSIRGEKDRERIKDFTPGQQNVRADWAVFKASKRLNSTGNIKIQMRDLEKMIAGIFG